MHKRLSWKIGLAGVSILLCAAMFPFVSAQADTLQVSLQPSTTSVSAGGTGSLEVVLTDVSGTGVTVGGFGFDLNASSPDVTFTGANTSTTGTYIFSGNSVADTLLGGNLTVSTSPDLTAVDNVLTPNTGTTLTVGDPVFLGDVLFNVSAAAPTEVVTIEFANLGTFTDLSDPSGNNIPIGTATAATVDITGTTVPEPSTLSMLLAAIVALLLLGMRTGYRFQS